MLSSVSHRKKTPVIVETAVITKSARRCPLCYHLDGYLEVKNGQIAHLDQDPSNSNEDNLVFMCLSHHSEYDSRTSQHKNFTKDEVKELRSRLYEAIDSCEHHSVKIRNEAANKEVNKVQQLISDSTREETPVSNLLRQAKVIAKEYQDQKLLDWIDKELNGYNNVLAGDLPLYRQFHGDAFGYNSFVGWKPIQFHSDEQKKDYTYATDGRSIPVIETSLKDINKIFILNSADSEQAIRKALSSSGVKVDTIQIRISRFKLHNIISSVRNYIHEWALGLDISN